LPTLRAQGSGTVLTVGSGAADRPVPGEVSLGVQKAALRNLTRAMAAELGDEGIHVAVVVVRGQIARGSALSPDTLAALLAGIAAETDGPRENWRTVVDLTPFGPNTVS
jgi:NAD(P)-dependent dehydrogenase (short-subunit alcohol dehydrogenase family)